MIKKRFGSGASNNTSPKKKAEAVYNRMASSSQHPELDDLSPELVPIVTLLSSQSHRRYHEGIFMLYYDLNGDGKPADREWKEVYGILTGNQLAYWDAANLAEFRNNPEALLEASSKPNYINFTDSVYNAMKSLPAAKQNLENVIIVSTTLKNRYIIQFKTYGDLTKWYSALRLANYEYSSLQMAYTGALLSARGSRLSDIRTVLAEKRFDHEDWVSIRYGSGMAWKRCYAVVEPSTNKKKHFTPGRILFFESEQKKKKQLMAVVSNASSVSAVYPQSPKLIDHSTMLKLEGYINFKSPSVTTKVSKKTLEDFKNTSIFMMPEEHSAVPGFDTLIRFLIPLLDSFGLYGRPTRLKADRIDPDSLLFGLPTLPHVHFLEMADVDPLTNRQDFLAWDVKQWTNELKSIMKGKLDRGYEGCGSSRGFLGAVNSLNSPGSSSGSFKRPSQPQKNMPSALSPQNSQFSANVHSGSNNSLPLQNQNHQFDRIPQGLGIEKTLSNNSNNSIPRPGQNGGVGYPAAVGAAAASASAGEVYRGAIYPGMQGSDPSLKKYDEYPNNNGLAASLPVGASEDDRRMNAHKSIQLADIYQKYSDIKSPSDKFDNKRNQILNGSHEKLVEDELPEGFKQISLQDFGLYPKNDDELFSEDDDEEDKLDSRQIGMLGSSSSTGLIVPPYGNRNSSYASVKSPMTQYHEFNEQFSKVVDGNPRRLPPQAYPNSDDEDEERNAPTPPPHSYSLDKETSPLNLSRNKPAYSSVAHGTTTPITSDSNAADYLSIHSESGKVQTTHSSPYSENSRDSGGNYPSDQRQLPSRSYDGTHRISSPNSSQNHYNAPSKAQAPPPPQIYVAGPSPIAQNPSQEVPRNFQGQPRPYSPAGPTPPPKQGPGYQQDPYKNQAYQSQPRAQPQTRSYDSPVPVVPPQQQSYPQSAQYASQKQVPPAPAPHQYQQNPPLQTKPRPPPQQYQQGPPSQQYQQGPPAPQKYQQGPPPPQQYQQGPPPPQQYQQGPPPQQYQQPPQQYRPAPQQYQQGVPPQSYRPPPQQQPRMPASSNYQRQHTPPQQVRMQPQSGIPPSVNVQQQRPQPQRTKSQTAANMRGYSDASPQYQYSYQVSPNPTPGASHHPERKPPPGPQPQAPRGNPYANSRQY
ncbi:CCR4-NOT transcriptional complex subunit Caf120p [[Candida] railenensis]|uniref:CCR4-NOT transcriptional complex subunit Caf120p n=1 Tax=[Candida] railenensis TaxID=45579 RepID=A0A9P0QQS1_9ASCO|nr:CCR4-NOT transcriptional complex subunit Caf120p [[Candida] railenensis]